MHPLHPPLSLVLHAGSAEAFNALAVRLEQRKALLPEADPDRPVAVDARTEELRRGDGAEDQGEGVDIGAALDRGQSLPRFARRKRGTIGIADDSGPPAGVLILS